MLWPIDRWPFSSNSLYDLSLHPQDVLAIRVRSTETTTPLYLPHDLSAMIRLRTNNDKVRLAWIQTYLRERRGYRQLSGKEIALEFVSVEKNPNGKFTQKVTPFWAGTL